MANAKPRSPRKLLIAGAGLAAVSFGGGLACGKAPTPMGISCPPGACGVATTGGTTGSQGVQYCGIPDGGVPIPCDQLDAGSGDGGQGDGG